MAGAAQREREEAADRGVVGVCGGGLAEPRDRVVDPAGGEQRPALGAAGPRAVAHAGPAGRRAAAFLIVASSARVIGWIDSRLPRRKRIMSASAGIVRSSASGTSRGSVATYS